MLGHSSDNDLLSVRHVPGVDKGPAEEQVHAALSLFVSALAADVDTWQLWSGRQKAEDQPAEGTGSQTKGWQVAKPEKKCPGPEFLFQHLPPTLRPVPSLRTIPGPAFVIIRCVQDPSLSPLATLYDKLCPFYRQENGGTRNVRIRPKLCSW